MKSFIVWFYMTGLAQTIKGILNFITLIICTIFFTTIIAGFTLNESRYFKWSLETTSFICAFIPTLTWLTFMLRPRRCPACLYRSGDKIPDKNIDPSKRATAELIG